MCSQGNCLNEDKWEVEIRDYQYNHFYNLILCTKHANDAMKLAIPHLIIVIPIKMEKE